ncbi:RICIN domain-containing protein [Micromonospora schwarzwaldensis]|uniref:RICIN domain-containing protein n=1 Tax=Micromonospora sp. DSM 45708 TaxID=3111767 RepID=UPI0031D0D5D8
MAGTRRWTAAVTAVLVSLVTVLTASPALAAPATLTPGAIWYDTSGARLQAHGAGIFKVGSLYYLVGEDKTAGSTFTAVACYSSTDLVTWTRRPNALVRGQADNGTGDLAAGRIVERPKVIYNSGTGKYVMWMHIDNSSYGDARAGVAISDTPCGPYTYLGSSRPLGYQSRDLGLFKDDDGTAYLLTEDRANGLRIDRLSTDYTKAVAVTALLPTLESPAMVKVAGRYFIFGSHLTGWSSNDNSYASATSLSGPWSSYATFAPAGSKTFNSQTSFILPVAGSTRTSYVYLGDRWNAADLNSSLPIWLPITFTAGSAAMPSFYESWSIDTATGDWVPVSFSLVGSQSGRCLDVTDNTSTWGAQAELWDCNGGENQQWLPTSAGELRAFGRSVCLDVLNQGTTPGSTVGIWGCNGQTNQRWTLKQDGTIVSARSGLCLDASGGGTGNGTALIVWTCNGQPNQKWTRR